MRIITARRFIYFIHLAADFTIAALIRGVYIHAYTYTYTCPVPCATDATPSSPYGPMALWLLPLHYTP